jgi:hypothetical protein
MIWGLSGRARSGKNTSADYLTATHGFVQVSLADPLRDLLSTMNPVIPTQRGYERLNDVLDQAGSFDGVKSADATAAREIRSLMQRAGTDWGRRTMNGVPWIVALEDYLGKHVKGWWSATGPMVVLTDVRFDNEARWVRLNHGRVVNIEREAATTDMHSSEAGISAGLIDYHVFNLGTKVELHAQLADIYKREKFNVAVA